MEPFTAAPHHDVLALLLQICVLLLAARGLGEVASRFGQPPVVGELLAGILLGPSVLGGFLPGMREWLVPEPGVSGYLLEVLSLLGALFLMLITGLETDLALIRRHARTAFGVSFGGIAVTFSSGYLLGRWLPDELLADPTARTVFALFVATAMSISAIPVIAKVLMDMNLMRRDIGQTIIAAGMSDDTVGWMLLSVVAGLAAGGAVTAWSVAQAVGRVVLFMVLSFTVGRWLVKRALDFVQDEVTAPERLVTLVIVLMFAWGALTQALGLEAVLGAFVVGILFGQMPRLPESVHHKLVTLAVGVFTPVFFATAGLKVNVRNLLEPRLIAIALLVIAVASLGKFTGTYLGARLIGRRDHWTALAFGAGLNARGAMEIIIATIGLELGILSQDMFSIIVLMAMATSLLAPPALRWVLEHVEPEEQELRRLQREEREAASVVAKIRRVLLPVRTRPRARADAVHAFEAWLLDRIGRKQKLYATLFNVSPPGERAQGEVFLDAVARDFHSVELTLRAVEATDPSQEILSEARKGYDLMILGATEQRGASDALFHPVVDQLVRLAPSPTLVVKRATTRGRWPPRKILVPTNGSVAARHAAEFAYLIADGAHDEVLVLHVVHDQPELYSYVRRESLAERQLQSAEQTVEELRALGEAQGVTVRAEVLQGGEVENVVIELSRREGIDLIVLGTDIRPGSSHLFLGPRVERMLAAAACPVLVLNVS